MFTSSKFQDNSLCALPNVAKISYTFEKELDSLIHDCSFDVTLGRALDSVQNQQSYSKLFTAGHPRPLLCYSLGTSQKDITVSGVIQITSGLNSIIALRSSGIPIGRGTNQNGELALGDTNARWGWTAISGFPSAVKQIAYNFDHSLFLTVDGQVYSCGDNSCGQLVCRLLLYNF